MTRQRRPQGPMWHATAAWKEQVLAAMERQGITRAELSRRVHVTDAAITVLFREATRQSRLVPLVNRVLGIAPPEQIAGPADEVRAELDQLWPNISADDRRTLMDIARRLARSK